MMRILIIAILLLVVYWALKTLIRSALGGYHDKGENARIQGEEMVFDPQCRIHVVKGRAVHRRIKGADYYFCSEECAREFEEHARR